MCITSRYSDGVQEEIRDPEPLLQHMLPRKTRGMEQSEGFSRPMSKNNNPNFENASIRWAHTCVMQHPKNFMALAIKSEVEELFEHFQKPISIQTGIAEMGRPQPSTSVATDNSALHNIANVTTKHKISIAIDMIFY